jgi:hypothetical protein
MIFYGFGTRYSLPLQLVHVAVSTRSLFGSKDGEIILTRQSTDALETEMKMRFHHN